MSRNLILGTPFQGFSSHHFLLILDLPSFVTTRPIFFQAVRLPKYSQLAGIDRAGFLRDLMGVAAAFEIELNNRRHLLDPELVSLCRLL